MKYTLCLNTRYSSKVNREIVCRLYKEKGSEMCQTCHKIKYPIVVSHVDEIHREIDAIRIERERQRIRYLKVHPEAKTIVNQRRRYFTHKIHDHLIIDLAL